MNFSSPTSDLQAKHQSLAEQIRQHWPDLVIVFVLMIAVGLASYLGAVFIGQNILDKANYGDTWFDSDVSAYFEALTNPDHPLHARTYKHPLFSLILSTPVYALKILGIETITALRLLIATIASLWLATLFILLRLIGCRRFDALLFSLLGATSAAAIFWLTIPESYPFGSLSILLALVLAALATYRPPPLWAYVAVNVMTLSITVTNWMAGLLTTVIGIQGRKQTLRIIALALFWVVVLAGVQKLFFPYAAFLPFVVSGKEGQYLLSPEADSHLNIVQSFISQAIVVSGKEGRYLLSPEAGGPLNIVQSFISHTMVMPEIQILPHPRTGAPIMLTQFSSPGSGYWWGAIIVGLWTALLGLGAWSFFSVKQHPKFRLVLSLILLGQLVLHLVYTGRETFLYSLHFAPLLVVFAAFSSLTRARLFGLILASLIVLTAGVNNSLQFNQAREFYLRSDSTSDHPSVIDSHFKRLPHPGLIEVTALDHSNSDEGI